MSAPLPRGLRVLIGAESFADAQQALRLVDRLGDAMIATLAGLMVEDDRLAMLPRMARQRLVTPGGALADPPDPRGTARWRDSDAAAFRGLLATVARQRDWTFDRAPGGIAAVAAHLAEYDMVVLGCRAMHRLPGQVVLISGPGAATEAASLLVNTLASALRTGVTEIAGSGTRLPADRLARMAAAAVVIDLGSECWPDPAALEELVAAARCPVLLCR
jgi:hypothetical protein